VPPFALALFAQTSPAFPYAPPTAPPPTDLFGALLRLSLLAAITLAICGGVIWWVRQATRKRILAANTAGRLVLEARLPLDARNAVVLLRADGHPVIVATDALGLKSITPLEPTFDAALDATEPPTPAAP
jgi:hypothetical protein